MNMSDNDSTYVLWFSDMGIEDVPAVGGKNASLGKMIRNLSNRGVRIPDGFATTSYAFREFIKKNKLEKPIRKHLGEYEGETIDLETAGHAIRQLILKSTFPTHLAEKIRKAYLDLCEKYKLPNVDVAVRSSATVEDLPHASFAGVMFTVDTETGFPNSIIINGSWGLACTENRCHVKHCNPGVGF